MKIAIIDPCLFTWPYTPLLCDSLSKNGCEVVLIASRFQFSIEEDTKKYAKLNHFYNKTFNLYNKPDRVFLKPYIKGLEHTYDMFRLVSILENISPDIIHYQISPIPFIDSIFLKRMRKIAPIVSTVHNTLPFHGDDSILQRIGFNSFLAKFDHLIVHTKYSMNELNKMLKVPKDFVSVFYHPMLDQYIPKNILKNFHSPSKSTNQQTILFFGNISYYKGLDILISAFGKLSKDRLNKTLLRIVGSPKIPINPIKMLAKEIGVEDRIIWDLRYIPDEEIPLIINDSTLICLPYRHIDGSGVFSTALCFGKPLVATKIGIFDEVLEDGVHGYLVNPEDSDGTAEALERILSNKKEAMRMGNAALELSRKWPSWDKMAKDSIGLYNSLINN